MLTPSQCGCQIKVNADHLDQIADDNDSSDDDVYELLHSNTGAEGMLYVHQCYCVGVAT